MALERAMNAGDVTVIAPLIHSDNTSFTGNGGMLNEAFDAAVLKANFERGLSLATRSKHVQVRTWGDTALLTAYAEGMVRVPGGAPKFEISRVTEVWRRDRGQWKQAHIHQSPVVAQSPPRPPAPGGAPAPRPPGAPPAAAPAASPAH